MTVAYKGRKGEDMISTIETLLGGEFSSDPRCSRFPLPEVPKGTPKGSSYIQSGVTVTPEMARDWVLHRTIRREVTPSELVHEDMCPNRKYLITYVKDMARKLSNNPDWWEHGTHQGAAFTEDGFLLDAQQRLAACAVSRVAITLPIAVGVPWSAWEAIDQNRRRHAAQMVDLPYATACASIARHLIPVLEKKSHILHTRTGNDYMSQVVEICLGWPYFAREHSWMREIHEAASESGVPTGALGSVCLGALAGGAEPDEVQQFLNGLRPLSRSTEYISIGSKGVDPRQLAARHFGKQRNRRDRKGRLPSDMERSSVGTIRHAMNLWLSRFDEKPWEVSVLNQWPERKDLPSLWGEEKIREFHRKFVI